MTHEGRQRGKTDGGRAGKRMSREPHKPSNGMDLCFWLAGKRGDGLEMGR